MGVRTGRATSRGGAKRSNARLNDTAILVVSAGVASASWDEVTRTLTVGVLASDIDTALGLSTILSTNAAGRLTLETGVPISTTNQTAKTTLYYQSMGQGGYIGLYTGSSWTSVAIGSGASLSLSGYTADSNYDIWAYSNAGVLTLESTIWTNNTTRATALTLQDGVYVKSGTVTRRYLGTIRTTSTTGQCEDSLTKRLVWNAYNRVARPVRVQDSTASWTYGTEAWRIANNSTANRFEYVQGLQAEPCHADLVWASSATVDTARLGGIGVNETGTPTGLSEITGTGIVSAPSHVTTLGQLGYNIINWIEYGSTTGTVTFYGNQNVEHMSGQVWG